jgi:A/G-specific adenine glycosylase
MDVKKLLTWSKQEFSALPWRQNRSLYRTLVSEIMLQQTTVGTVKNHYEKFLTTFPDLESLASASENELIVAWKGLGYYRRARSLKKIAEAIAKDHKGEFPHDLEHLQMISGIGPYTANAIVSIGMDKRALAVDANLERVISRLYGIQTAKGPKLQKEISELFLNNKILSGKYSWRALNEALMDLGRTFCQARKASCELCPLKNECHAYSQGKPLMFPVDLTLKKKSQQHELTLLRAYVVKKRKILVYEKAEGEWLSGQFEVPTFIISTTDEKLSQYQRLKGKLTGKKAILKTGITKYKIINHLVETDEKQLKTWGFARKLVWKDLQKAESNLSTTTLKGLKTPPSTQLLR